MYNHKGYWALGLFFFSGFNSRVMLALWTSPGQQVVKNLPTSAGDIEMQLQSLGWEGPWRRAGNPLQHSCLETPMAEEPGGHGVTKSQTWLRRLNMHRTSPETCDYGDLHGKKDLGLWDRGCVGASVWSHESLQSGKASLSYSEGDVTMTERHRDLPLLALEMKEGNTSKGVWIDFGRWTRWGNKNTALTRPGA